MEESESQLQEFFINLLNDHGYEYIEIKNEDELISNFKKQLKLFNKNIDFNFNEVLDYLYQGDMTTKFDKLRNSYNGLKFIDFSDFSSNIFQVTQEITMVGDYTNRYDVTILINGLPLVQFELKKSGVQLKSAFNQIQRYFNHSYSGLFNLTQIYVISNKVNTRFFFNDSNFKYNLTYNWFDNYDLESFTNSFLNKDTLMSILKNYIYKDPLSNKFLMLRPYQIEAIKCVLKQIENNENGYVWLNPNTGNSIVSLRIAEILSENYKVIHLIPHYPLNYPNSVKSKKEFLNAIDCQNLVVTNIKSILSLNEMELSKIKDEKFIFLFNDYEKNTLKYSPIHLKHMFKNSLFYCFTSTPLFDENRIFDMTTKSIFDNQLTTYSFKDALTDKINLPMNVIYVNDPNINFEYNLSSQLRSDSISNYILEKQADNRFKSIFVVSSNNDLIKYYELLKKSNLNVVSILRHSTEDIYESKPMRDYFEEYINEYNSKFSANIIHKKVVDTSRISKKLEEDILKRFNDGEIDLIIIDKSMFDDEYQMNILKNLKNPLIDTVYLDCNLDYGNLFEVMSMANGAFDKKTKANIILFRDLREEIKKTISLFSDNNSSENYDFKDYEAYLNLYKDILSQINDNNLIEEFEKLDNYYNILKSFTEFDFTTSQNDEFNYYKDKFEHEIYKMESNKKIISDFDLELLDQFTIDLNYIFEDNIDETQEIREITKNNIIFDETTNNILNISNVDYSRSLHEDTTNILSLKSIDNSKNIKVENNNQDLSKTVNIKNEYHIHIGGDNIPQINNVLDLSKLIESKNNIESDSDLVKICPRCRKKYIERYNYCPDHDEKIKLAYISDLIKSCSKCNRTYPKEYNYCTECGSDEPLIFEIKKIETRPNELYNFNYYYNRFNEISQLLLPENIEKLKDFNLSEEEFNNIINNIKNTYKNIIDYLIEEYNIDFDSLTPLNKMLLFSKSFVKTYYKNGGGDLGHFEFNEIYIDERATDALQITTIIHELSHFLLAEILEQIVSILLDCEKTDVVEAFVCYNLAKVELNYLIDEYCAHTVEGSYAVFGYQDYGSYEASLSRFLQEFSEDHVEIANGIGNTFAQYIKEIMGSFIDEKLRSDIKEEFSKIKDIPKYNGLKYETTDVFEWERFSKSIQIMLTSNIEEFINNPQVIEKLKLYAIKFKKNNEG